MTRQGTIWSGAIIAGIGLLVTLISISTAQPGQSYVIATGAIFWGFVRLARGLGMREIDRDETSRDVNPAPLGADTAPVIGGASCALCHATIVSRLDGTACPTCARPLHHDCRTEHTAKCGVGGVPYRS
jgi:uncharacterized paraquat-inducible protein A